MTPGAKLGPYEILDAIGAGGMGEVYRARDTRLDRIVAIKTSKEQFSERFEREARAVAALNHANICTIHDVGPNYIVMEYIEGPTLAERIHAGAIPLAEALPIARQIAAALEAAHEKGIVHRDLKPANVKITPDGKVKVLDFGLAKTFDTDSAAGDSRNSPTLTLSATRAGMILGTAGYMSPEQARGVPADKRADIWSFGVVLFEMLTGRATFAGETVSDTLAAVLRADLNWSALPPDTPPHIRRLLRRCLERDRKLRLHDIADAALELDEAPEPAAAPAGRNPRWPIAALGLAVLIALALAAVHFRETPPPPAPTARFEIPLPPKSTFGNHLSLSPDGRLIAFAAASPDVHTSLIWVRPIDSLEARPLAGTDNGGYMFWSPDSRFIGFWAAGRLKRIEAAGGPAQNICETGLALGGAWGADGTIVFGSNAGGIFRVPASGGTPTPVTRVDAANHEAYHGWPVLLPGGKHLLYLSGAANILDQSTIHLATLDTNFRVTSQKELCHSRSAAFFVPAPHSSRGHLFFLRENTLMAQPFDAGRLELAGDPVTVATQIGSFLSRPYFAASLSGTLVYRTGTGTVGTHLEWLDRTGKPLGAFGTTRYTVDMALAHDGTRVAVSRGESAAGADIWQLDARRTTRFTFHSGGQSNPVWSPDDSRIAFASGNPAALVQKISSGAGAEDVLLRLPVSARPCDWSRDGKYLLYVTEDPKTRPDLWVLPLAPGSKPAPYLQTEFAEIQGQFSPDGHWVAYASDESGMLEVYVQPFPASGGKWQISTGGGSQPRWRGDGKELYYLAPDRSLMAVEIQRAASFEAGAPKVLFVSRVLPVQTLSSQSFRYAPAADGKRFLMITAEEDTVDSPFTVILNWRPGGAK